MRLPILVTILSSAACHVFSDERLCSSDVNCEPRTVCVAGECAAPVIEADRGGDDVNVNGNANANDGGDGDGGDGGDGGEGGGDGGDDDGIGLVDEEPIGDGAGDDDGDAGVLVDVSFAVKLVWRDSVDLDLHVIRSDENGQFCRETRSLKPRDRTVVVNAADVASDCATPPRLDCTYRSCDELGVYDIDWLADGSSAVHTIAAEPVLMALDGVSGDQRDGLPGEEVSVPVAPRGSYLVAAAHPSAGHDTFAECAVISIEKNGIEQFCRTLNINGDEWKEAALIDIDASTFAIASSLPADACTCP